MVGHDRSAPVMAFNAAVAAGRHCGDRQNPHRHPPVL